ncbi:921_t:CDS:1, partial [Entrophospora sp. SA101]
VLYLKTYQIVQRKALILWPKIGGGSKTAFTLAIQMNNYEAFNFPYISDELQIPQS